MPSQGQGCRCASTPQAFFKYRHRDSLLRAAAGIEEFKVAVLGSLTGPWCADNTPPVITCPTSVIVVELGTSHPIGAIATDASGPPTIDCPDTATLAPGVKQPVVCTATDASEISRTCTALVTVVGALRCRLCGTTEEHRSRDAASSDGPSSCTHLHCLNLVLAASSGLPLVAIMPAHHL